VKKTLASLTAIVLFALLLQPLLIMGQEKSPKPSDPPPPGHFEQPENKDGKPKGWTVKLYSKEHDGVAPDWVDNAYKRSLDYLKHIGDKNQRIKVRGKLKDKSSSQGKGNSSTRAVALAESWSEYTPVAAEVDDYGYTHTRLDQTYNSVPVFGGQVITEMDSSNNVVDATGYIYQDASYVSTQPQISAQQAINSAQTALGYGGNFAKTPTAELVVLPNEVRNRDENDVDGATLVYKVELLVEDGTDSTARWFYFVNANNGSIEWQYDAMNKGSGQSLYSGNVGFPTYLYNTDWWVNVYTICGNYLGNSNFYMLDGSGNYGYMGVTDMNNSTDPNFAGYRIVHPPHYNPYPSFNDDNWGLNTGCFDPNNTGRCNCDALRERAAVDAQFGMGITWDYFKIYQGRRGIDNLGYSMTSRVHFGNNFGRAQWNGTNLTFGDGYGNSQPLVSIDSVAHEWTHGVTEKITKLTNTSESGAANESFSDIFGTMVEFISGVYGRAPNYLIGEDYGVPLRSLANPPAYYNGVDYYGNRVFPGYCTPNSGNDNCGIHQNSGIMSKAFYLLAEGGTHPYSRIQVSGIGRDQAARIFYTALSTGITPTANLHDMEGATYSAAVHLNGGLAGGMQSYQAQAVLQAWKAVGVPQNQIDEPWFFMNRQYLDLLGRYPDQGGWAYWANSFQQQCAVTDQTCNHNRRLATILGFFYSPEYTSNNPALSSANRYSTDPNAEHIYNSAFVDQCYRRFLRRPPEAGGLVYWTDWLDSRRPNNDTHYTTLIDAFTLSLEYRRRSCCGD